MKRQMFLSGDQLWGEITRLAATARGQKQVAVAYVGPGGTDDLQLGSGDALHCALSLRNASLGVVAPAELLKLRERKVRLYADENLHAKIYLFGKAAIVGSANASRRSRSLDEAGLLTRDVTTLRAIRGWFRERQDVEISDDFLQQCAAVYRPPTGPFVDGGKKPTPANGARTRITKRPRSNAERWWILWNVRDIGYTAKEEALAEKAVVDAKQRLKQSRWDNLEPIAWHGRNEIVTNMRRGDKIICTVPSGRGQAITPWGTCIAVKRWKTPSGAPRIMIAADFPDSEAQLGYAEFLQRARARGLPITALGRSRYYDDPRSIRVLRQLTSPRSLRRR